jgi:hypothetical protein
VPASCTGKLQPADAGLNRVFKSALKVQCQAWLARKLLAEIKKRDPNWNDPDAPERDDLPTIKLNLNMSAIKPNLVNWLYSAWSKVQNSAPLAANQI